MKKFNIFSRNIFSDEEIYFFINQNSIRFEWLLRLIIGENISLHIFASAERKMFNAIESVNRNEIHCGKTDNEMKRRKINEGCDWKKKRRDD